ncbi:MAG: ParB/RepB/Spo0J family partition protein [Bdellovibrionota bacterium]
MSGQFQSSNQSLLSKNKFQLGVFSEKESKKYSQQLENIPINLLHPMENQPRRFFDAESIEELAQSIRTYGILQPLIVTLDDDKNMIIIAGERRWRAAQLAGLTELPCIFREIVEHSKLELALIENIQREELSPLDEANSMLQLLNEYEYTHEALANRLGKSRSTVTHAIRMLSLPEKITQDLSAKLITAGHARALCTLEEEKLQLKAHQIILTKKLSVRQTEDLIRNLKKEKEPKKLVDHISPDLRYVCDQFKGHLGTKVKIAGDTNRGKIEISYYTLDDLERISELILGNFSLGEKQ